MHLGIWRKRSPAYGAKFGGLAPPEMRSRTAVNSSAVHSGNEQSGYWFVWGQSRRRGGAAVRQLGGFTTFNSPTLQHSVTPTGDAGRCLGPASKHPAPYPRRLRRHSQTSSPFNHTKICGSVGVE